MKVLHVVANPADEPWIRQAAEKGDLATKHKDTNLHKESECSLFLALCFFALSP